MTPIEAELKVTTSIDVDAENPDHAAAIYAGSPVVEEHDYVKGILQKVEALKNTYNDPKSEDKTISKEDVYAFFWEDMGDYYRLRIEDYVKIRVSKKVMNEFMRRNLCN